MQACHLINLPGHHTNFVMHANYNFNQGDSVSGHLLVKVCKAFKANRSIRYNHQHNLCGDPILEG
jgi:hypothetical protein